MKSPLIRVLLWVQFAAYAVAQNVPVSWSISATATESYSAIPGNLSVSGGAGNTGHAETNSFIPTYQETCKVSYTLDTRGARSSSAGINIYSQASGQTRIPLLDDSIFGDF